MKRNKMWFLTLTFVVAFGPIGLTVPKLRAAQTNTQTDASAANRWLLLRGLENYDVRYDPGADAQVTGSGLDQFAGGNEQRDSLGRMRARMSEAESSLRLRAPELTVQYSQALAAPEIVEARGDHPVFLTSPSVDQHEKILRRFVTQNAGLYGLTRRQIALLKKTADYTNPDGNLSWVTLQQEINGIPVFLGEMRAAFTAQGELVRTVSEIVPGVDYSTIPDLPLVSAVEALPIAAGSINMDIETGRLPVKSSSATEVVFESGPFTEETKARLQYFPLRAGAVSLAWSMVLWGEESSYYTFIDAFSGKLLFRKNITQDQTQNATYVVYNDDSPGPLSPSNAIPGSGIQGPAIGRTTFTFVSELPAFDNLGWITDGVNTTTGNNVDAGLDVTSPNGIDNNGRPTGSPNRVFNFAYNPPPGGADVPTGSNYRFGAVTNLFFWSNRYHDRLYQLGFTEAARNFQTNNFGRGGSGNDPVRAEVQDRSGTNNANFATPSDGSPPRMQMFIFTGPTPDRDGDLDGDVFLHEITHGTSNRLHGNAGGLSFAQGGGMGEGWSDFYARAILSDATEDVNGVYAAGAYVTRQLSSLGTDNYYYGIRRFPYAVKTNVGANGKPHNPLTFADIDVAQINTTDGAFPKSPIIGNTANEVHNIGELWCMALLEVRARLITRLGWATGNQRMLQLVTDAMKLDPTNPTLLDGRNSLIAAANALGGTDVADIWAGFAARGMGTGATVSSATSSTITVTESFLVP